MTEEARLALESVLPPRKVDAHPPPEAMTDDYALEVVDPTREANRARGMAMDDDDEDMHGGAERVQCASQ